MIESYGVNAEKMSYVGIDPGVHTGWALIDQGGKLLGSGTFDEDTLYAGLDKLVRGCHRSNRAVTVVVERMPPGHMGDLAQRLERVRQLIAEVVTETYELPTAYVTPGEWKRSRVAKITRWPEPFATQHAEDAATMALYYADKVKRQAAKEKP